MLAEGPSFYIEFVNLSGKAARPLLPVSYAT